jgi:hypothetical protein
MYIRGSGKLRPGRARIEEEGRSNLLVHGDLLPLEFPQAA